METWWRAGVTAVLILLSLAQSTHGKAKGVVDCWECSNYDLTGKFYDQCPKDGTVDPIRAYQGNCSGKCFTHNNDVETKLVVRGCTGSQWGLPDPLPADGCYPWYSEIWCVCSTDGCNGVALGTPKKGAVQFDSHIDYNKPAGTGDDDDDYGAASHLVASWTTFQLTLVLSVLGFVP
ncbi:uncharacterized protein [Littorina saxatilis]|uniref:Uncharacterized protein n=1 Tax=Littorina saxatilis TaxID=31220 RepID=A0AAN9AW13_9CAEN